MGLGIWEIEASGSLGFVQNGRRAPPPPYQGSLANLTLFPASGQQAHHSLLKQPNTLLPSRMWGSSSSAG